METKTKLLVIHDWMISLGLTDKQQKLFALIYGYSQDGCSRMRGTAASLAEWLGCSQRNAQILTRQLEALGLIAHEVVFDRKRGCNVTEFWAVLDDELQEKKTKINWAGKGRPVYETNFVNDCETNFVNGYETNFVNHKRVSRYSNNSNINKNRGGNNSARRARKTTTTTTGDLFKDESILILPYEEDFFREAWETLLRQPKWQGRSADALRYTLEDLGAVYDPVIATYCCELAVKRGWDCIENPQTIFEQDRDKVLAFADKLRARGEGGEK